MKLLTIKSIWAMGKPVGEEISLPHRVPSMHVPGTGGAVRRKLRACMRPARHKHLPEGALQGHLSLSLIHVWMIRLTGLLPEISFQRDWF